MGKQILFDTEARKRLMTGMKLLSRAVGITLGPRGRYVVVERRRGKPLITRDGDSVAKHFSLRDGFAELGVNLLKRVVLEKTASVAGAFLTLECAIAGKE